MSVHLYSETSDAEIATIVDWCLKKIQNDSCYSKWYIVYFNWYSGDYLLNKYGLELWFGSLKVIL